MSAFAWWLALLLSFHHGSRTAGELPALHCMATHPRSEWVSVCHVVIVPPIKSPPPIEYGPR